MIAETAEALDADMVIVGSHGRSALARAALGQRLARPGLVVVHRPRDGRPGVPAPASVATGDKAQEA